MHNTLWVIGYYCIEIIFSLFNVFIKALFLEKKHAKMMINMTVT